MRGVRVSLIVASLWLQDTATAETEIHKCTDADGGIVYSQLPCTPQKPAKPEKTETVEAAEPVPVRPESVRRGSPVTESLEQSPELDANRAACKKRYREAIDVIDAEIGREYSPEKGDEYKQRLLALTRKLREC